MTSNSHLSLAVCQTLISSCQLLRRLAQISPAPEQLTSRPAWHRRSFTQQSTSVLAYSLIFINSIATPTEAATRPKVNPSRGPGVFSTGSAPVPDSATIITTNRATPATLEAASGRQTAVLSAPSIQRPLLNQPLQTLEEPLHWSPRPQTGCEPSSTGHARPASGRSRDRFSPRPRRASPSASPRPCQWPLPATTYQGASSARPAATVSTNALSHERGQPVYNSFSWHRSNPRPGRAARSAICNRSLRDCSRDHFRLRPGHCSSSNSHSRPGKSSTNSSADYARYRLDRTSLSFSHSWQRKARSIRSSSRSSSRCRTWSRSHSRHGMQHVTRPPEGLPVLRSRRCASSLQTRQLYDCLASYYPGYMIPTLPAVKPPRRHVHFSYHGIHPRLRSQITLWTNLGA